MIIRLLSENFHYLVVKFSVYLNRRVFVIIIGIGHEWLVDHCLESRVMLHVVNYPYMHQTPMTEFFLLHSFQFPGFFFFLNIFH